METKEEIAANLRQMHGENVEDCHIADYPNGHGLLFNIDIVPSDNGDVYFASVPVERGGNGYTVIFEWEPIPERDHTPEEAAALIVELAEKAEKTKTLFNN